MTETGVVPKGDKLATVVLITNKHKRSKRSDDKADAAARVRRDTKPDVRALDEPVILRHQKSGLDRRATHTGDKHCPVCCADLPFTGRGGRRVRGCPRCGATYRPDRQCAHCSQHRVWQGPEGLYCQGCGHPVGQT